MSRLTTCIRRDYSVSLTPKQYGVLLPQFESVRAQMVAVGALEVAHKAPPNACITYGLSVSLDDWEHRDAIEIIIRDNCREKRTPHATYTTVKVKTLTGEWCAGKATLTTFHLDKSPNGLRVQLMEWESGRTTAELVTGDARTFAFTTYASGEF